MEPPGATAESGGEEQADGGDNLKVGELVGAFHCPLRRAARARGHLVPCCVGRCLSWTRMANCMKAGSRM
jgi:hypothetical protein